MVFNLIQRNMVTGQEGVYGSVVGKAHEDADDVRFYADQACKQANEYLNDIGNFDEYVRVESVDIIGN